MALADVSAFKWIRDALDKDDPATGTSVPVLVVADSGGCAEDIYNYVLGPSKQWLASEAERESFLPVEGTGRDAAYVREAKRWLPEIASFGADTGQNDSRQLSFFKLSEDASMGQKEDLALVIQHALLNDCPNVSQEALLAVSWGEPSILQQQLDVHSEKILSAQKLAAKNGEKHTTDLLQLALLRQDTAVVDTLLRFIPSPAYIEIDRLFESKFNRYSTRDTRDLWTPTETAKSRSPRKLRKSNSVSGGPGAAPASASGTRRFLTRQASSFSGAAVGSSRLLFRQGSSSRIEPTTGDNSARNSSSVRHFRAEELKKCKRRPHWRVLEEAIDGYDVHLLARYELEGPDYGACVFARTRARPCSTAELQLHPPFSPTAFESSNDMRS